MQVPITVLHISTYLHKWINKNDLIIVDEINGQGFNGKRKGKVK